MKQRIAMLFVILVMLASTYQPALSGKPGPTPYPRPGEVVTQGDAYPEPQQGLPAPELPEAPADFCDGPLPRVCNWGPTVGEWYVTVHGANAPDPGLRPLICTALLGVPGATNCQEMTWRRWNYYTDTNVYTAPFQKHECTDFGNHPVYVIYTYAPPYGWGETIPPNEWVIRCVWLPVTPRVW